MRKRSTSKVTRVKEEIRKIIKKGVTQRQIEKDTGLKYGSVWYFLTGCKGIRKRNKSH